MERRTFLFQSAQVSAYGLLLSQLYACKGDTSAINEVNKQLMINRDAPYAMDYVRGDVGFFTERGGTIGWMANKNGIVIIDTQFPKQVGNLMAELTKIKDKRIDMVINTHHHGDHTSGNLALKDAADVIVAHKNSKANQYEVAVEREKRDEMYLPTETFTDTVTKKIGGETISLSYFGPGHTNGDAIVHFENANVVHMGDLIFNRKFPYIDMRAGADIENWIVALDKSLGTFDNESRFIFGHSDNGHDVVGSKEDIKAFKNYLEQLMNLGRKSIAAGKTAAELIESYEVIPGAEEWKGRGIDRSIEAVYTQLKRG